MSGFLLRLRNVAKLWVCRRGGILWLLLLRRGRNKIASIHPFLNPKGKEGSRERNSLVSSVNYDKGRVLFCCGPYIGSGESRPQEMSQVVDEDLILECLRFGECGSQTNSK